MNILGIIGARSGSKGVPDKNIRMLAGRPLMGWIIEAAKNSRHLTRVIVSTDSEKYAQVARDCGADVPVLRPENLSSDKSPEYDYVKFTVEWLKDHENFVPDVVVRMFPTVPLQTSEDIDRCIDELLKDPTADSAVVVAEARQHPQKALKLVDDGRGGKYLTTYLTESGREVTPIARQNYARAYFRANVIACRLPTIYNTQSLTGDRVRYHLIPQERGIDIDSETDFFVAEKLMERFGKVGP